MGKSVNNDPRGSARDKNLAKKAAAQAEKDREAAAAEERREAASWLIGAKCDRKAWEESERDRKLKMKAEREALLAQEESIFAGSNKRGFTVGKKKKGKDDFELLTAALNQQVKTKAQLQMEAKKKEVEERKRKEEEARIAKLQRSEEEEKYRMEQMSLGICVDHTDDLLTHSKEDNFIEDNSDEGSVGSETINVTGINSAIDALKQDVPTKDSHPERRRKALYLTFEAEMLPVLREEFPRLRLTQYQQKIFALWQKSERNPENFI